MTTTTTETTTEMGDALADEIRRDPRSADRMTAVERQALVRKAIAAGTPPRWGGRKVASVDGAEYRAGGGVELRLVGRRTTEVVSGNVLHVLARECNRHGVMLLPSERAAVALDSATTTLVFRGVDLQRMARYFDEELERVDKYIEWMRNDVARVRGETAARMALVGEVSGGTASAAAQREVLSLIGSVSLDRLPHAEYLYDEAYEAYRAFVAAAAAFEAAAHEYTTLATLGA